MYNHIQPIYKINSFDVDAEVKAWVLGRSRFSVLADK